ncbi:hypothetical protein MSG28_011093 [Choristoneura fumiferana]|uniref:Uncharacterized protein n=2 Tax=Choristoneura fumiferana TaxID=7141 RepID=A0ACC0KQR9_CHOFU|nr:hypothetical protein MSG28_011092 [Choristoneura fumiferana]KAI8438675.1 hypothetical protein MSG28_011093 [Choristoneura fumiferana]
MVVFMRQTTYSDNREDQMWARRAFTAGNHIGLDTEHEFTVTVIRLSLVRRQQGSGVAAAWHRLRSGGERPSTGHRRTRKNF